MACTTLAMSEPPEVAEPHDVIDPQGDVLIKLDSGQKLLASSTVLRLASPMMSALLFKPNFVEGRTQRSHENPQEVVLHGDKRDSWRLLLLIMHCQSGALHSLQPIAQLLLDLVMLADKYQCIPVIQPECYRWLDRYEMDLLELPALNKLAKATYFLNDVKHFPIITAAILRDGSGKMLEVVSSPTLREILGRAQSRNLLQEISAVQTQFKSLLLCTSVSPYQELCIKCLSSGVSTWDIVNVPDTGGLHICYGSASDPCEFRFWVRCMKDTREEAFCTILKREKLWPLTSAMSDGPHRAVFSGRRFFSHDCALRPCPLNDAVDTLVTRLVAIREGNKGIDLADFKDELAKNDEQW